MIRVTVIGITALVITGCTTNETDASRLSMGDLLFGQKRLNSHLEQRRASLDQLIGQSAKLSVRVYQSERELRQLDDSVQAERQQSGAVAASQQKLQKESKALQSKLASVEQQLSVLNSDLSNLQAERSRKGDEQTTLHEQIAQNEEAIASLEREMLVLERAIDRIVTARARHGLETQ